MNAICIVTFLLTFVFPPFPSWAEVAGRPQIIDGDTLEIGGQRIRLHGIDAPENNQTCTAGAKPWNCGREATLALIHETAEHWIRCEEKDLDRYGRIVAVCYVGAHDINANMVRKGWALAYRQYSMDYVGEEAAAKSEHAGVWRGEFTPPWQWRVQHATGGAHPSTPPAAVPSPTKPGECVIKGNISSKGERIFHVPGGRWYDQTEIDTAKGERWFCSEAEARAAGWRRSIR